MGEPHENLCKVNFYWSYQVTQFFENSFKFWDQKHTIFSLALRTNWMNALELVYIV